LKAFSTADALTQHIDTVNLSKRIERLAISAWLEEEKGW
jgi:hypothetical protein